MTDESFDEAPPQHLWYHRYLQDLVNALTAAGRY
ncbi:hypothetical protein GA0115280_10529 [Streptomyces sp. Cmuel-A718b]|nr:hypothetical protein GA0115280_10529 [Streptomyces sp. Cmuel-A718b]